MNSSAKTAPSTPGIDHTSLTVAVIMGLCSIATLSPQLSRYSAYAVAGGVALSIITAFLIPRRIQHVALWLVAIGLMAILAVEWPRTWDIIKEKSARNSEIGALSSETTAYTTPGTQIEVVGKEPERFKPAQVIQPSPIQSIPVPMIVQVMPATQPAVEPSGTTQAMPIAPRTSMVTSVPAVAERVQAESVARPPEIVQLVDAPSHAVSEDVRAAVAEETPRAERSVAESEAGPLVPRAVGQQQPLVAAGTSGAYQQGSPAPASVPEQQSQSSAFNQNPYQRSGQARRNTQVGQAHSSGAYPRSASYGNRPMPTASQTEAWRNRSATYSSGTSPAYQRTRIANRTPFTTSSATSQNPYGSRGVRESTNYRQGNWQSYPSTVRETPSYLSRSAVPNTTPLNDRYGSTFLQPTPRPSNRWQPTNAIVPRFVPSRVPMPVPTRTFNGGQNYVHAAPRRGR